MCHHLPPYPPVGAPDREAALLMAYHPEQGWGLLRKGVVIFDGTDELPPDGRVVPAPRITGIPVTAAPGPRLLAAR